MGVPSRAQLRVRVLACLVPYHAGSRPVVESVAEAFIGAAAHDHDFLFSALLCNGCGAAITAQGVVISFRDGLRGLAEHRGGDFSSQSRQGEKDGGVTMLLSAFGWGGQFVQQGADAPGQIGALLMEQAQPRQQQQGMFDGGFGGAGSQGERFGFQHRAHLGSRDAADAVLLKQAFDLGLCESGGAAWRRSQLEQIPQPGLLGGLA